MTLKTHVLNYCRESFSEMLRGFGSTPALLTTQPQGEALSALLQGSASLLPFAFNPDWPELLMFHRAR